LAEPAGGATRTARSSVWSVGVTVRLYCPIPCTLTAQIHWLLRRREQTTPVDPWAPTMAIGAASLGWVSRPWSRTARRRGKGGCGGGHGQMHAGGEWAPAHQGAEQRDADRPADLAAGIEPAIRTYSARGRRYLVWSRAADGCQICSSADSELRTGPTSRRR
jgi:hypothetical protein